MISDTLTTDEATVSAFLAQMSDDNRADSTVVTYASTLQLWIHWLHDHGKSLETVEPSDLREFATRWRPKAPQGAAAATRRRDIVTVRLLHQWAHEEGYPIRTLQSVRTPKVIEPGPKPIHDDVWRKMWTSKLRRDDRLFLGLGYFLGLRRIEIVTIPPTAVDFPSEGLMRFVRKGGRDEAIEWVHMTSSVAAELPWLAEGWEIWVDMVRVEADEREGLGANQLWWDTTDDPRNDANRLNKRMYRIMMGLGLTGQATPHRLRHSCATNLLRAGWTDAEVRNALSHSSIDITQRYVDYTGQARRRMEREQGNHERDPRHNSS